ncbi:MBL fold metallo-hydrolase [Archangium lansingense]|uniref:MBL fold metallo-hydrolase n=1 Tax=Archangium lansingense TaxID=2995310 RepID=A0ABT4AKT2_9BACT|nr:MBL fold metallo-hydrolase [Archangium lansinium]MCY1082298.1 MBL fold metallo-hydrolase [Archangium lansinium]
MMGFIFEELNGGASCRTYLIVSPRTRQALIVDPVLELVPGYMQRLAKDQLRLTMVVDTHTHADHLSGGRELARMTGAVHAGAPEGSVQRPLHDGEVLAVGDVHLTVWASPGHTSDALVLVMEDRVLTGDTLLIGATGRTDLPTGDAEAEYLSLQRLLSLPGELLVFPAHDYGGRTFSTIGHERLTNPRLRLDHEAFIRLMTSPRAEKPARLTESLAYNTRPLEARDEPVEQLSVF